LKASFALEIKEKTSKENYGLPGGSIIFNAKYLFHDSLSDG
jgi:hypothetical protein